MKVTKQVADSKEKEVKTEKQEKVREEWDVAGVSKEEIPAKKNEWVEFHTCLYWACNILF